MKPYFVAIPVECWKHAGARLETVTPSVCIHHTTAEAGEQLLTALDELKAEAPKAKRTLTFQPSARKRGISTLRLLLSPVRDDLRVMCITCENETTSIEMTPLGFELVRDAIVSWLKGGEDYCVAPDHAGIKNRDLGSLDRSSGELWFWGPTMEP